MLTPLLTYPEILGSIPSLAGEFFSRKELFHSSLCALVCKFIVTLKVIRKINYLYIRYVGLDGLGETCSPREPRFAGSNPAEVDGFFQEHKSSGRDFKPGVPSLRFKAR